MVDGNVMVNVKVGLQIQKMMIIFSHVYFRTATSTWSMGKMFVAWQKVLCMLKFEKVKIKNHPFGEKIKLKDLFLLY